MKRVITTLLALATAPAQAKDRAFRIGDSLYYDKDHWIVASTDERVVDPRLIGDRVEFPDVRIVIIGNVTHIGRMAECSTNAQAIEMSGASVSVRVRSWPCRGHPAEGRHCHIDLFGQRRWQELRHQQ